jgi:hypothetical protein
VNTLHKGDDDDDNTDSISYRSMDENKHNTTGIDQGIKYLQCLLLTLNGN